MSDCCLLGPNVIAVAAEQQTLSFAAQRARSEDARRQAVRALVRWRPVGTLAKRATFGALLRWLLRSVHVREAKRAGASAEDVVVDQVILLAGRLVDAVHVGWTNEVRFADRQRELGDESGAWAGVVSSLPARGSCLGSPGTRRERPLRNERQPGLLTVVWPS